MHDVPWEPLRRRRITWLVCFAAMALMLWGCGRSGPKYWPVSGKVTFRGKPVAVGLVRFTIRRWESMLSRNLTPTANTSSSPPTEGIAGRDLSGGGDAQC